MHFQNIHTFTYQTTLLHTLFCLFLKLSKAFSVSLKIWEIIVETADIDPRTLQLTQIIQKR